MSTFKLTYFDGRGRAESIRMLFVVAGQQFEDNRLTSEQWRELKEKTPMGQLPILEVDGEMYCQSKAIARYVARKFGFGGKTEKDMMRVDMVVDCIDDSIKPLLAVFGAETEENKTQVKNDYLANSPAMLEKIDKLLKSNKSNSGWFVGDDITWADIIFQNIMDMITNMMKVDLKLDNFPELKALHTKVENHPKIAEWISKRK